jgi:hypothetical protein
MAKTFPNLKKIEAQWTPSTRNIKRNFTMPHHSQIVQNQ